MFYVHRTGAPPIKVVAITWKVRTRHSVECGYYAIAEDGPSYVELGKTKCVRCHVCY
jgi:hypothetical protein